MFPPQAPWSGIGQLESKIDRLQHEINQKANSYEIASFNSRLDSLEHSVSGFSSEITELRYQLSEIQSNAHEK